MTDWRIVLRDVNENRLGQLRGWTQATFIPRYSGIGAWSLDIPYDAPIADLIAPGCGIVAYRDGKQILSGPIRRYFESWDGSRKKPVIQISGITDEYLLRTRVAFPNPSSAITSQTVNATRKIGPALAETVAKTVVQENLLNTATAVSDRFMQNLTIGPDLGRGSSIKVSLRFDVILTWLQTALPPAGLGFRITYSDADKYVFDVVVPRDLSLDVVFSRGARNITGYNYSIEAPETTTVFVAGSGVGTARAFTQVTNAPPYTWGYRAEQFLDRRDTSDSAEMLQAGNDALYEEGIEPTSFGFSVLDTDEVQFGRDYDLGDKVGFRIRDSLFANTVNLARYELDPDSERIMPIVGNFESDQLQVYGVVKSLARRLALLERRA